MRILEVTPIVHRVNNIRYLKSPGAALIAEPKFLAEPLRPFLAGYDPEYTEYVDETLDVLNRGALSDGAALTKWSGQICYLSVGEKRTRHDKADVYFDNIMKQSHGSILEHANYSVLLYGVDRAVTHEWVRHRAGAAYCLSGDTLIYSERKHGSARNGARKRKLSDLYKMNETHHGRSRMKLLKLRCLDETTGNFVTGRVRAIVQSGVKPVFRVELEDGKHIKCTKNHRFHTADGWDSLENIVHGLTIAPGGRLAVHGALDRALSVNGQELYRDPEWLREQYVVKNLDQEQIGKLAGVSKHCIRTWVRVHKLQKPMGSWTRGKTPWNKDKSYTTGPFHTAESKAKIGASKRGENNPHWKGGITKARVSLQKEVQRHRQEIFTRDLHACRLCKTPGGDLVLHHILPVWSRPDLALELTNIATVCETCHVTRLNGHELDYVEILGRSHTEIGAPRPKRADQTFRAKLVKIKSVTYVGEEMTYDIEMEGANHNFVANGIVTHNSQISQRFVGLNELRFVMPYEDINDPVLHEQTLKDFEIDYARYAWRINQYLLRYPQKDGETKTDARKRVQSVARRVLPNWVEAPIVVTHNIRAWRHVLTMRCSPHADVAIRRAGMVCLDLMRGAAPELFRDFEETTLPDGSRSAKPLYMKV